MVANTHSIAQKITPFKGLFSGLLSRCFSWSFFGWGLWSFGSFDGFGWSLSGFNWSFLDWFFLWLVLAKLVLVFAFGRLLRSFFVPIWELDAILLEDEGDARRWFSTILEVEFDLFSVEHYFFGCWVVIADLSNDTT